MAVNKPEKETKSEKNTLDTTIKTKGTNQTLERPEKVSPTFTLPTDDSKKSENQKRLEAQQKEAADEKAKQNSIARIGSDDESVNRAIDKALGAFGGIAVGNTSVGGLTKTFTKDMNEVAAGWQAIWDPSKRPSLNMLDHKARNHVHARTGFDSGWTWGGKPKDWLGEGSPEVIAQYVDYNNDARDGKGIYSKRAYTQSESGKILEYTERGDEGYANLDPLTGDLKIEKPQEKYASSKETPSDPNGINLEGKSFVGVVSRLDPQKKTDGATTVENISIDHIARPLSMDASKESPSNVWDKLLDKYLSKEFSNYDDKAPTSPFKYKKGSFSKALRDFSSLPSPVNSTQFVMAVNDGDNWYPLSFRVKSVKLPDLSRSAKDTYYGNAAISLPVNNLVAEKSFSSDIILDQATQEGENNKYYNILENLLQMFGYVKNEDGWNLNMMGNFNYRTFPSAVLFVVPGWVFHDSHILNTGKSRVDVKNGISPDKAYLDSYENGKGEGELKIDNLNKASSFPTYVFENFRISSFKIDFSFDSTKKAPWTANGTFTYTDVYEASTSKLTLNQIISLLYTGTIEADKNSSDNKDKILGNSFFQEIPQS